MLVLPYRSLEPRISWHRPLSAAPYGADTSAQRRVAGKGCGMALGNKKDKELERAVDAAAAQLPSSPARPEDAARVEDEEETLATSDALVAEDPSGAGLLAAEPEPAPADGGAGGGGDDLLSMFETGELETTDLSVTAGLAGDVELDDLLEELHTVAAAIGISVGLQARDAA